MEILSINYGELLIIDPGYITNVYNVVNGERSPRFDALKCVKTLHEGDDGLYEVNIDDKRVRLGVDSGRIWVLQAEFGVEVEIDAGLSGFCHVCGDKLSLDKIKIMQ